MKVRLPPLPVPPIENRQAKWLLSVVIVHMAIRGRPTHWLAGLAKCNCFKSCLWSRSTRLDSIVRIHGTKRPLDWLHLVCFVCVVPSELNLIDNPLSERVDRMIDFN